MDLLFTQNFMVSMEILDRFKEIASFYLVEKGTKQYLVKVTDDFIVTNELTEKVDSHKFVVGNYKYTKGYQIV